MARPKALEPRDQQLLLRLTARQLQVLESLAHLEHSKPNTYAHQILVEHLAAMAKNPRVQADLANRAAYDSDAAATLPLRDHAASATHLLPSGNRTRGARRNTL